MSRFFLSLHDQVVELCCPDNLDDDVRLLFGAGYAKDVTPQHRITINEDEDHCLSMVDDSTPRSAVGFSRDEFPMVVMEAVSHALIVDLHTAVALHSGAVAWDDNSILIAGQTGAGKSSLVAWFVDKGFEYLTDELIVVPTGTPEILGFQRALAVKAGSRDNVADLPALREAPAINTSCQLMVRPLAARNPSRPLRQCSLIIFPNFVDGAALRIEVRSSAQAALGLMACNVNASNLGDGGIGTISAISRGAVSISVQYGGFHQLDGVLDALARLVLDAVDPSAIRRLLSVFGKPSVPARSATKKYPIPQPTPAGSAKKLTIGMATYDDYDGVYFSLQSLRLYHPEIVDNVEFLVVDNHPDGPCSDALKSIESSVASYRYVPHRSRVGTSARNVVFEEASGNFVLCIDCHVLIVPGAVKRLLDYFDANPDTLDLIQGPLLADNLINLSTHFHPEWRAAMYGTWALGGLGREPDAPPFEIPMQGLGLFACRRAVWPGFNSRFRGFGGEEGYIHEKFRQAGGRTLCLPFLRWVHRFNRPLGVPYPNTIEDRVWNYWIGRRELGLPTDDLEKHVSELVGETRANLIFTRIRRELESI
jgi:hypothetical protein